MSTGRRQARRTALFLLYQWDLTGQPLGSLYLEDIDPFALELAKPVVETAADLDARITDAAEHWTIERMPLVDRNLLRLAAFELAARPEVPTAVVLDEAIELAKLLSTADSGRFVNGVLAHIANEVRGAG